MDENARSAGELHHCECRVYAALTLLWFLTMGFSAYHWLGSISREWLSIALYAEVGLFFAIFGYLIWAKVYYRRRA